MKKVVVLMRMLALSLFGMLGSSLVSQTAVADDCSYYAAHIRFNSGGGSGNMPTETMRLSDCAESVYILPACRFTRSGYSFAGWEVDNACEISYTNPIRQPGYEIYDLCGDLTLTATWTRDTSDDDCYYTAYIRFYPGGGSGSMSTVTKRINLCSGSTSYTLPACGFTRTGYKFAGWEVDNACEVSYTNPIRQPGYKIDDLCGDLTLTATWSKTATTHVMTLYRNNSAGDGAGARRTVTDNGNYTLPTISSLGWTRSGYTFKGWARSRGGAVEYLDGERINVSPSLSSLYAVWQSNASKHVMTLYRNNSSGDGAGARRTVTDNGSYTLPTISSLGWTRSGYTFRGWATYRGASYASYGDGECIYVGSSLTSLYAVWEDHTHVMTLYRNNSSGDGAGARRKVPDGGYYTLPTISSLGWTRSGYTFRGWATYRGASYASYGDGERIYVYSWTDSLYAVWEDTSVKYTIRLHRNYSAGDGATAGRTMVVDSWRDLPTIDSLGWSRSGYYFAGWAYYPEASYYDVNYWDGESVSNLSYYGGDEVHLFAVWW